MKQVAILPSGVQIHSKGSILYFDENRILYASTLAVYVLDAKSFVLIKILSLNTRAISSISISKFDSNLLIVGGSDGSICLWNINDEEVISRINTLNGSVLVAWDPFSSNHCAVISNAQNLKFLYWDSRRGAGTSMTEVFSIRNNEVKATVARWNPNLEGQLAVGCNNGAVFIFNHLDKSQKLLQHKDDTDKKEVSTQPVVDIQYDRLSALYMIVAYSYFMVLWDVESSSEIVVFERQNMQITSIAWMDWTTGNFLSTNNKNNSFKIWNASQKQPIDTIKITNPNQNSITDCGINTVYFCPGQKRLLTASMDGCISVYNIFRKLLEYSSFSGHTETIFDAKFSPVSPNIFCTASYDGTVKMWNIYDLSLVRTFHSSDEAVVYCMDFNPKGTMICTTNINGLVTLYDIESGREMARYLHHTKQSYCISWNKLTDNLLCSTSSDCTMIIFYVNTAKLYDSNSNSSVQLGSRRKGEKNKDLTLSDIRYQFKHPAPVFGCSWSPTHAPIIASCCQDGNVRIFNHLLSVQLVSVLVGHTARAFNCAWSPLLPGHLATASDDTNVLVWEINLGKCLTLDIPDYTHAPKLSPKQILTGHTSNARALQWNHEHKNLLLSGSWDSCVRLWDVVTGVCLFTLTDHIADVYAIAAHPERPFTYVTASRDTTVRVWELDGVFARIRYNAVFDCSLDRVTSANALVNAKSFDSRQDLSDNDSITAQIDEAQALVTCNETIQDGAVHNPPNANSKMVTVLAPFLNGTGSVAVNNALRQNAMGSSPGPLPTVDSADQVDEDGSRPHSTSTVKHQYARSIPSDPLKLATHFYKIFTFFNGATGAMDIWENVLTLLTNKNALEQKGNMKQSHNASFNFQSASQVKYLRPPHMRIVLNENEALSKAKSDARKQEAQKGANNLVRGKFGSEMSAKVEEQMRATALSFVRTGDFLKYCTIMIELGDWTAALALAPAVSLDYWKDVCHRYSQQLINAQSEQCVPYLLGTGKDADVVEFYLSREETSHAMTAAKMSETRTDLIPEHFSVFNTPSAGSFSPTPFKSIASVNGVSGQNSMGKPPQSPQPGKQFSFLNISSNNNSFMASPNKFTNNTHRSIGGQNSTFNRSMMSLNDINVDDPEDADGSNGNTPLGRSQHPNVRDRTEKEVEESRLIVKSVATQGANVFLQSAKPLLAAAHYLAVNDVPSALTLLGNNAEYDLAYSIALCFGLDTTPYLIEMADKCAALTAVDLAIDMLQTMKSSDQADREIGLLLSRYCSDSKYRKIITVRGLRSINSWLNAAKEEENIGSDADAVISYIIGRQYSKAATLGLSALTKAIREPWDMTVNSKKLLRALKYLKATELDEALRMSFLCTILWFSAHEAMTIGLWDTAADMLSILVDHAERGRFLIPPIHVKFQLLGVLVYSGKKSEAGRLVETLLKTDLRSPMPTEFNKVYEYVESLSSLINKERLNVAVSGGGKPGENMSLLMSKVAIRNSILEGAWGNNTNSILTELQRIAEGLSLPVLSNMQGSSKRSQAANLDALASGRGVGTLTGNLQTTSVLQGSLLPTSNQQLKAFVSVISSTRIQGTSVQLSEAQAGSYVSVNELCCWKRVNPYSPLMNGDFIFM